MANSVHGGLAAAGWPPRAASTISAATKYLAIGSARTSFGMGFADDARIYLDLYPNLLKAQGSRGILKRSTPTASSPPSTV